jgi:predicted transcriptional regulator
MVKDNRLVSEFYSLKVHQMMDKRIWDLPIVDKTEDINTIMNILGARNHIWVVENKKNRELVGVITEHDVLSILAPKELPPYVFGLPNLRSIQLGTAKTAEEIMRSKVMFCRTDDKIVDILEKMTAYKLRRLPVVDDKKIIGEITLNQLIRKYYNATQYHPMLDEK